MYDSETNWDICSNLDNVNGSGSSWVSLITNETTKFNVYKILNTNKNILICSIVSFHFF